MGRAADRWPAKWLMLVSVLIIGLGYLYLSRVTTLMTFYIGFMITALGSSLGFSMTPTTTVARWFNLVSVLVE